MAFVKYDGEDAKKLGKEAVAESKDMIALDDESIANVAEVIASKTKAKKTVQSSDQPSAYVTVSPPKFQTLVVTIEGTAPYVQNKFSHKAMEKIKEKQKAGSTAKKGAAREGKDFEECFREAIHVSTEGWCGIPAPALRNAMISACRIVGFQMTRAKLAVFVEADGIDATDGTPLVRITQGEPQYLESFTRNATGVIDLRARAMFAPGWRANVKITHDADIFTPTDVVNLLFRAGQQVGIGEGRPDSKNSAGLGWGLFRIMEEKENKESK